MENKKMINLNIKENLRMEKEKDMENVIIKMENIIKVDG